MLTDIQNRIICIIFFFSINAFGQDQAYRDSVVNSLSLLQTDEEKLQTLIKLVVMSPTTEDVENWSLQAITLATRLKDEKAITDIMFYRGRNYLNAGHEKIGLELMHDALDDAIQKEDSISIASMNYGIGVYFYLKDEIDFAVPYFEACVKVYPTYGDSIEKATILMAVGVIMAGAARFEEGLNYQLQALRIKTEKNAIDKIPISLNNLADLYIGLGKKELAEKYIDRSIALSDSLHDDGAFYFAHYLKARILKEKKRYREAIIYLEPSVEFWEENEWENNYINAYTLISELYANQGRYQEAYIFLKKLYEYVNTSYNAEQETAAKEIATKYETEKKELEIQQERQARELAQTENELTQSRQRERLIIFAAICIFLGFNILYFYRRYKQQRRDKEIIAMQNQEIMDSIVYARRIQTAILPSDKLVRELLPQSFILYKPKDVVAGDFYWLETVTGDSSLTESEDSITVLFAAADCTGHGVPGAMVSVICNNGLNRSVREYNLSNPGQILDRTREIVIKEFEKSQEEVKDGMDIALCSLRQVSGADSFYTLRYAGAHNPLWVIRKGQQVIEEIKANKQPIGRFDNPQPFTTHELKLNSGDTVYIFTDGFADQFGGDKGKKFKTANFKELLLSIQNEPFSMHKELINKAFENWKGKLEQVDDVCVIGVRI